MDPELGIYLFALSVALSVIYYYTVSVVYRCEVSYSEPEYVKSISIIIAAKDEADNLERHLPLILQQKYEGLEVIVIDDNSKDGSIDILRKLSSEYSNLIYESLGSGSGKKDAVARGVEVANHEWLLFTDADCAPSSEHWIAYMTSQIKSTTKMVLGYSPFRKMAGSVNTLARVDAFTIGVQYLAFALLGRPYMGVGRNMAYKKELFKETGGFESHKDIRSGDDDLFVQEANVKSDVAVELEVNSQTNSESKTSLASWFSQKRRHTSAGFRYKLTHLFLLGLIQLNIIAFYVLCLYNLSMGTFIWITVFLALIRFYSQYYVLKKSALKLGEIDLLLLSFVLELPLIVINMTAAVSNILFKKRGWS